MNRQFAAVASLVTVGGLGVWGLKRNYGPKSVVPAVEVTSLSHNPDPPVVDTSPTRRWASIVIGGGTAGCVAARRIADALEELNAPPSYRVLLLERGPPLDARQGSSEHWIAPSVQDWFEVYGSGSVHSSRTLAPPSSPPLHAASVGESDAVQSSTTTPTQFADAVDHIGLGGCSMHHTSIVNGDSPPNIAAVAAAAHVPPILLRAYEQAQLTWRVISPSAAPRERYFDDLIRLISRRIALGGGKGVCAPSSTLASSPLVASTSPPHTACSPSEVAQCGRAPFDEHRAMYMPGSIAYCNLDVDSDGVKGASVDLVMESTRPPVDGAFAAHADDDDAPDASGALVGGDGAQGGVHDVTLGGVVGGVRGARAVGRIDVVPFVEADRIVWVGRGEGEGGHLDCGGGGGGGGGVTSTTTATSASTPSAPPPPFPSLTSSTPSTPSHTVSPPSPSTSHSPLAASGVLGRTALGPAFFALAPGGQIIVAAGAFGVPAVLLRSGLGTPDTLQAANVPPTEWISTTTRFMGADHAEVAVRWALPPHAPARWAAAAGTAEGDGALISQSALEAPTTRPPRWFHAPLPRSLRALAEAAVGRMQWDADAAVGAVGACGGAGGGADSAGGGADGVDSSDPPRSLAPLSSHVDADTADADDTAADHHDRHYRRHPTPRWPYLQSLLHAAQAAADAQLSRAVVAQSVVGVDSAPEAPRAASADASLPRVVGVDGADGASVTAAAASSTSAAAAASSTSAAAAAAVSSAASSSDPDLPMEVPPIEVQPDAPIEVPGAHAHGSLASWPPSGGLMGWPVTMYLPLHPHTPHPVAFCHVSVCGMPYDGLTITPNIVLPDRGEGGFEVRPLEGAWPEYVAMNQQKVSGDGPPPSVSPPPSTSSSSSSSSQPSSSSSSSSQPLSSSSASSSPLVVDEALFEQLQRVHASTAGPRVHFPTILQHRESPRDLSFLRRAVRAVCALDEELKAAGLVSHRVAPSRHVLLEDDEQLTEYIRRHTGTPFHWCSTAAEVVNPQGRLCLHEGYESGPSDDATSSWQRASRVHTSSPASTSTSWPCFAPPTASPTANVWVTSCAALPIPPAANTHIPAEAHAARVAVNVARALADAAAGSSVTAADGSVTAAGGSGAAGDDQPAAAAAAAAAAADAPPTWPHVPSTWIPQSVLDAMVRVAAVGDLDVGCSVREAHPQHPLRDYMMQRRDVLASEAQ